MTSSETQTETPSRSGRPTARGRIILAVSLGLVAVGWLVILVVNKWHLSAPVVFLALGWLALVVTGRAFLVAAQAGATEVGELGSDGFEITAGREVELEREKRALLKAIKEVEFDREMGKLSEADAVEISRVYRARAIDILKELEASGDGGQVAGKAGTLDEMIDREVRARLALAGVAARRKSARPNGTDAKPAAGSGSGGAATEPSSSAGAEPAPTSETKPAAAPAPAQATEVSTAAASPSPPPSEAESAADSGSDGDGESESSKPGPQAGPESEKRGEA